MRYILPNLRAFRIFAPIQRLIVFGWTPIQSAASLTVRTDGMSRPEARTRLSRSLGLSWFLLLPFRAPFFIPGRIFLGTRPSRVPASLAVDGNLGDIITSRFLSAFADQ